MLLSRVNPFDITPKKIRLRSVDALGQPRTALELTGLILRMRGR
jgi:hypothetical protein